ncbi:AAA family ATPase [Peribacillus frigoritolerans]|uniref:AAA family ATPase n=1 Tax=Peribacillus frigoritolerans TaxID=450367 RepID=UPI00227F5C57|nr:ATP-binding protein [Peribacillus frigoritolerans]MCY9007210.1 AAA family ATPase [Peribacillus frigoritolerans]
MLNSVKIHNFKGLSDFELRDISRINLLGGRNNAGKTTVLEALFMFYDRLNPNMLLRQYNWRGVNEMALTPDSVFSPIFKNFDFNNQIAVEVTNHRNFVENMTIKYKEDSNKSIKMKSNDGQIRTDDIAQNSYLEIKYKSSTYKEQHVNLVIENNGLTLDVKNARNNDIKASFLASKTHLHPNENAIRFGELDIKGQADVIIDFLKIIEPRLTSISSVALTNGTSMLYANIGIGTKVPISYMGDGISRVLSILLSIITNKNGIVFIDEIENGIHYSVIPEVWEIISKAAIDYNCQIFATTHSYECLNAALEGIKDEIKDEFRYFRIERSKKDDKIHSKIFDYEVLQSAVDRGWEVR